MAAAEGSVEQSPFCHVSYLPLGDDTLCSTSFPSFDRGRDVRRARLDQTLQRLTRIIDITEADQNRPSPRTVEKALLNRSGGTLATAMNDVEIGAATTRKRLAFGLGA